MTRWDSPRRTRQRWARSTTSSVTGISEASYSYGHDTERSTSQYGINNAALTAALARTDPATALNPFSTAPNNTAALQGLANQLFIAPGDTHFEGWELKFDGPLATLPGGELRAAIGYEGQLPDERVGIDHRHLGSAGASHHAGSQAHGELSLRGGVHPAVWRRKRAAGSARTRARSRRAF